MTITQNNIIMKKQERVYKFITWNIKKIKHSGKGTISSKEFDKLCCDTFNYFRLGKKNSSNTEKVQTVEAIISGYGKWKVVRENDKVSFRPNKGIIVSSIIRIAATFFLIKKTIEKKRAQQMAIQQGV